MQRHFGWIKNLLYELFGIGKNGPKYNFRLNFIYVRIHFSISERIWRIFVKGGDQLRYTCTSFFMRINFKCLLLYLPFSTGNKNDALNLKVHKQTTPTVNLHSVAINTGIAYVHVCIYTLYMLINYFNLQCKS